MGLGPHSSTQGIDSTVAEFSADSKLEIIHSDQVFICKGKEDNSNVIWDLQEMRPACSTRDAAAAWLATMDIFSTTTVNMHITLSCGQGASLGSGAARGGAQP